MCRIAIAFGLESYNASHSSSYRHCAVNILYKQWRARTFYIYTHTIRSYRMIRKKNVRLSNRTNMHRHQHNVAVMKSNANGIVALHKELCATHDNKLYFRNIQLAVTFPLVGFFSSSARRFSWIVIGVIQSIFLASHSHCVYLFCSWHIFLPFRSIQSLSRYPILYLFCTFSFHFTSIWDTSVIRKSSHFACTRK